MDSIQGGYYAIQLVEEPHTDAEPTWFAEHPDLPGCHAVGSTPDEARANLERSREAWLKWAEKQEIPVPPPAEEPSVFVQYAIQRDVSRTKGTGADIAEQQTFEVSK